MEKFTVQERKDLSLMIALELSRREMGVTELLKVINEGDEVPQSLSEYGDFSKIDISNCKLDTSEVKNNVPGNYTYYVMCNGSKYSEKLQVVSAEKAKTLIAFGEKVASPKINVKTEKWDGGHTYISISFYDYDTNQSIAVIKSSGIGWSISQDQKLAYKAIKKELDKVFPQTR
jgi:hypothetical protein